jgi:hypothetical protein
MIYTGALRENKEIHVMKLKRILLPTVVATLLIISMALLSCGGGGGYTNMEGTWTITTTPGEANPEFGNGTYELTLIVSSDELKRDLYSGDGTIDGEPYKFSVTVKHEADLDGNDYYMFIYKDGESLSEDSLECYGLRTYNTAASGPYLGNGTYASYGTGTFSTLKQ